MAPRWLLLGIVFATGCRIPLVEDWTPRGDGALWDAVDADPIPVPPGLAEHSRLADVSAWQQSGLSGSRTDGGTYGVGNSVVFGIIGMDSPWNTLTGAIGPGYQRSEGFFGDSWIDLTVDGEAATLEAEQVQRARGSAVVRTLARAGGLTLTTTDFAPPGWPVIVRHVTLTNEGEATVAGFRFGLAGDHEAVDGGLEQTRDDRRLRISCPSAGDTEWAEELQTGDRVEFTCWLSFREEPDEFAIPESSASVLLSQTFASADQLLARAMTLSTPDPLVADLYEGMLITLMTQTSELGVVSPMNRYTSGWLRDSDGPVRLYMRAGLFEEARLILEKTYESMVVREAITNSFGLDVDLSGFEEPDDPDTFWAEADFMPGRQAAEAPSYLPLLWWEYLRRSDDAALLGGGRLAMLEACVRRQQRSDEDLLRFSGDETYRLLLSLALEGQPEELGWSAQSSFLYAAAAERVVDMGGDPQLADEATEVREAAEAAYLSSAGFYSPVAFFDGGAFRAPFEDVSTYPLWTGYGDPADPVQGANVDALVELLGRDDGVPVSEAPDGSGPIAGHTGMVPGLYLQNLAAVHHDAEESGFAGLGLAATVSGHFEEAHRSSDHAPLAGIHQADGLGADAPARYRPWEGGDSVAGMLDYLLGVDFDPVEGRLRIAPHLPSTWGAMSASDLRIGVVRFDVSLVGYAEGLVLDLSGPQPGMTVDLVLHADAPVDGVWVGGERVDVEIGTLIRIDGIEWPAAEPLRIIAEYE